MSGNLYDNERVWQITLNGNPVTQMLDSSNARTYDPTQAVKAILDIDSVAVMHKLRENDVFTFTLLADGP